MSADNDNGQNIRAQRCPCCGKASQMKFRPFCSGRCKDVDLARWLNGAYAIPDNSDKDFQEHDATREALEARR